MGLVSGALVAVAVLSGFGACAIADEPEIPQASFEVLQEVFTGVRDDLLDSMDQYWHRGQYERCIGILRLITEMDPTDVQAFDDAAWLMQNQLRDEEAEAFLLIGLRKNPDNYNPYEDLGFFYYTHERPVESLFMYEQAMIMGAPRVTWHRLAHSYEQAGHFYDAFHIWHNLQSLEPDAIVPKIQMDRMLAGEPAPDVPGFLSRAREERKRQAAEKTAEPE